MPENPDVPSQWAPGVGVFNPRGVTKLTMKTLPELPELWEWRVRVEGFWAACLFTPDVDCYVEVDGSSVRISTGVAPLEIVEAVIKANSKEPP